MHYESETNGPEALGYLSPRAFEQQREYAALAT